MRDNTAMQMLLVVALLLGAALSPGPAATTRDRAAQSAPPSPADRIDINHASVAELMRAPGLTRLWAERIVRFRPYTSKRALVEQGVLPDALYDRVKERLIAHRER